jgi:hypothetical protein
MTQTLQLSGNENVWLMDDGTLQIYGIKICDTEAELGQGEIVGIQYPSEFAIQLLDFLKAHESILMEGCGADIPSGQQEPFFDADEDKDLFDDDDDDADIGTSEDPFSPSYEAD